MFIYVNEFNGEILLFSSLKKYRNLTLFRPGGSLGTPPKVSVHNSQSFWDDSLKFGDFS